MAASRTRSLSWPRSNLTPNPGVMPRASAVTELTAYTTVQPSSTMFPSGSRTCSSSSVPTDAKSNVWMKKPRGRFEASISRSTCRQSLHAIATGRRVSRHSAEGRRPRTRVGCKVRTRNCKRSASQARLNSRTFAGVAVRIDRGWTIFSQGSSANVAGLGGKLTAGAARGRTSLRGTRRVRPAATARGNVARWPAGATAARR